MSTLSFPNSLARNGWTPWHLVQALALCAMGMIVTWDAWADIFHIAWRDEESSQIWLVPIVALWLFWVRRSRLRQVQPGGMWLGTLIVAAGWALHWIGDSYLIQSFWHGGAVIVVVGCFLSVIGKDALREFLPAFIVLLMLVPVPGMIRQEIALPLQNASAHVTQIVFSMFGMTVDRTGNALSINGQELLIAEACNGLRMVFALSLVSYAFAFGIPLRGYVRAIVLLASPVLAVVANGVRLIPTVYFYGYASMDFADGFHNASGWLMLVVAFLMLIAILAALRWALVPVTQYTLAYD